MNNNKNLRYRFKKFAVQIIKLTFLLPKNAAGYAIANQIVKSGTSIGANSVEANDAISTKEFLYSIV